MKLEDLFSLKKELSYDYEVIFQLNNKTVTILVTDEDEEGDEIEFSYKLNLLINLAEQYSYSLDKVTEFATCEADDITMLIFKRDR